MFVALSGGIWPHSCSRWRARAPTDSVPVMAGGSPRVFTERTAEFSEARRWLFEVCMPVWRLREFRDEDLDQGIQIWEQSRAPATGEPVFALAEVMAAARAGQSAVVAEVGGEMVGMAVAQIYGERAWVLLVALAARWRRRGIGSALLAELERRLRSNGVRRICTLVPEGATGSVAFENSGYLRRAGLVYYELLEPLPPRSPPCWPNWAGGCFHRDCGSRWPGWTERRRSSNAGSCCL